MNSSLSRAKISNLNMRNTTYHDQFSGTKQNSVDILFKGLKRKISQKSYSKVKNSFKIRQDIRQMVPLTSNLINKPKLKLSIISNKLFDPEYAHEQLLKLKEANHTLEGQNTQILRKIRKQQKIEQIYNKKIQGKQLNELDYFKALEIKLLLQVQALQSDLELKQQAYLETLAYVKSKKNSFRGQLTQKHLQMYEAMINNEEDLAEIQKEKRSIVAKKIITLENLTENIERNKSIKHNKNQALNQIKKQIKDLRQKFKPVQEQGKNGKKAAQLIGIANLMSKLMTNSQKFSYGKENSSTILKNNMSSISVKNRSNIEELQKQIEKIKEQYEMINSEIQQSMDQKIKKKILLHKQINQIQEKQRKERDIEKRNLICNNTGGLGKNMQQLPASRADLSANLLKCSIVTG